MAVVYEPIPHLIEVHQTVMAAMITRAQDEFLTWRFGDPQFCRSGYQLVHSNPSGNESLRFDYFVGAGFFQLVASWTFMAVQALKRIFRKLRKASVN